MPRFHETLRERRAKAGMDEVRASFLLGLNVHEYDDLECHSDEWRSVTPLYTLLFACRLFGIDLAQFAPQTGSAQSQAGSPGDVIKRRRLDQGLSESDFAHRCGFQERFTDLVETGDGILIYPFDIACAVCRTLDLDLVSFLDKTIGPVT